MNFSALAEWWVVVVPIAVCLLFARGPLDRLVGSLFDSKWPGASIIAVLVIFVYFGCYVLSVGFAFVIVSEGSSSMVRAVFTDRYASYVSKILGLSGSIGVGYALYLVEERRGESDAKFKCKVLEAMCLVHPNILRSILFGSFTDAERTLLVKKSTMGNRVYPIVPKLPKQSRATTLAEMRAAMLPRLGGPEGQDNASTPIRVEDMERILRKLYGEQYEARFKEISQKLKRQGKP